MTLGIIGLILLAAVSGMGFISTFVFYFQRHLTNKRHVTELEQVKATYQPQVSSEFTDGPRQTIMVSQNITSSGGGFTRFLSVLFLICAICAYLEAEFMWMSTPSYSVGALLAGTISIIYDRAITFALIAVGFGVLSIRIGSR